MPESFYTQATNPEIVPKSKIAMEGIEGKCDGKVTEVMDCFSSNIVKANIKWIAT